MIVPVYGFVKDYAKEKGIAYSNMDELLQHPKIQALFRARIDTLQQQFAHYEQVKRFTLLPEPFSMERGELTNTLKLKRSIVAKNYKELIDKIRRIKLCFFVYNRPTWGESFSFRAGRSVFYLLLLNRKKLPPALRETNHLYTADWQFLCFLLFLQQLL